MITLEKRPTSVDAGQHPARPTTKRCTTGTILLLSSDRTSLTVALVDAESPSEVLAQGQVIRIGQEHASLEMVSQNRALIQRRLPWLDHPMALRLVFWALHDLCSGWTGNLRSIEHHVESADGPHLAARVVECGSDLEALWEIAPLDNWQVVRMLREVLKVLPDVPHIVYFSAADECEAGESAEQSASASLTDRDASAPARHALAFSE